MTSSKTNITNGIPNTPNEHLIDRYYSQHGEDYLLDQFFESKKDGYFIDVGAFDGVHLSNSYTFERKGWSGICVEPQQFYVDLCRKSRPNSHVVHAACVADRRTASVPLTQDATGLFSSIHLDINQENIRGHYRSLSLEKIRTKVENVPALTLDAILAKGFPESRKTIDFISIDVEGSEFEVLKGLDLVRYPARVLLLETNSAESKDELTDCLGSQGYIFARSVGANSFFVRSEKDAIRLRKIEISCTIEKQIHPRGLGYSQTEFLEGKVIVSGLGLPILLGERTRLQSKLESSQTRANKLVEELNETRLERNAKVATLLDLVEELRSERNQKVAELHGRTESLIKELENSKQERNEKVAEQQLRVEHLVGKLNKAKIERKEKVATLLGQIEELRGERDRKVAELLKIIELMKASY